MSGKILYPTHRTNQIHGGVGNHVMPRLKSFAPALRGGKDVNVTATRDFIPGYFRNLPSGGTTIAQTAAAEPIPANHLPSRRIHIKPLPRPLERRINPLNPRRKSRSVLPIRQPVPVSHACRRSAPPDPIPRQSSAAACQFLCKCLILQTKKFSLILADYSAQTAKLGINGRSSRRDTPEIRFFDKSLLLLHLKNNTFVFIHL
jgi:hypothetical protein